MSFLFETFSVPLWFLVFTFGCAAPLWIRWYKKVYKKVISMDFFEDKFDDFEESKSEDISLFQKATDNWNASVDHDRKSEKLKKSSQEHSAKSADQPYIKIVLKTLAVNGDAGMLIQSIADKLEVSSNKIKSSLSYLEENEFVDAVVGSMGAKYYLSDRGKKYCIKRGYIAD